MGIRQRIEDAAFLYRNGRREGAILSALVAVAATARRRYPKPPHDDRAGFSMFLDEETVVLTGGAVRALHVRVPGADLREFPDGVMSIGTMMYKYVRCQLAHEASLPETVEFTPEQSRIQIEVTADRIRLSDSFLGGLGNAVRYAPENVSEFPDLLDLSIDHLGEGLFGSRAKNLTDYLERWERRRNEVVSNP